MKLPIIGVLAFSFAMAPMAFANDDKNDHAKIEPTANTICLDTRLTYEGAQSCKEEMARADSADMRQKVLEKYAARIGGQTPLRNSLTSSGAGVKDATPVPANKRP